jgi:hypothetical protein
LNLDNAGIERLVRQHDDHTKAIKEELLRICWYMRGGLSYNEAHLLTVEERELVNKIIEGNLETTKETQLPFF